MFGFVAKTDFNRMYSYTKYVLGRYEATLTTTPIQWECSFNPRSYNRQGLRMARVIMHIAVSSPTMVSLPGSHLILRPVRMAMSVR